MNVRAKVTPTLIDAGIRVIIEWVNVENEQVGEVLGTEEFSIAINRMGSSYVSRIAVEQASELPATFWIDERGKRHFSLLAEAGVVGVTGAEIGA